MAEFRAYSDKYGFRHRRARRDRDRVPSSRFSARASPTAHHVQRHPHRASPRSAWSSASRAPRPDHLSRPLSPTASRRKPMEAGREPPVHPRDHLRAAERDRRLGRDHARLLVGTPWTLAAYSVEGGSPPDQDQTKIMAQEPEVLDVPARTSPTRSRCTCATQRRCGAQVVQLFDSWAHHLSARQFLEFSLPYSERVIAAVKAKHPRAGRHLPRQRRRRGGSGDEGRLHRGRHRPRLEHEHGGRRGRRGPEARVCRGTWTAVPVASELLSATTRNCPGRGGRQRAAPSGTASAPRRGTWASSPTRRGPRLRPGRWRRELGSDRGEGEGGGDPITPPEEARRSLPRVRRASSARPRPTRGFVARAAQCRARAASASAVSLSLSVRVSSRRLAARAR